MTGFPTRSPLSRLAGHEGREVFGASEAVLKGLLESEVEVTQVLGPAGPTFAALFEAAQEAEVAAPLLRAHGIQVRSVPDAGRAVRLAVQAARAGRQVLTLVPNRQLELVEGIFQRLAVPALTDGGLCLLLEDDPAAAPLTCPRRLAMDLGLPCVEPRDVEQLRDMMDFALRLSRAGNVPVAVVVHESILRSSDTLPVRPNRVIDTVDALLARRRRRRSRLSETGGVLRVARRLELNRVQSMPSPGERLGSGFIVVGPASAALRHIAHTLRLAGRIPMIQLGLISPLDNAPISRLLTCCDHVVVLEPRPGVVEARVLEAAEEVRQRAGRCAAVWGRRLPPTTADEHPTLGPGDAVHPSVLVRKIVHLLHELRPALHVASRLRPDPKPIELTVRDEPAIGVRAALAELRDLLAEVDQWVRERRIEEDEEPPERTALAVDGMDPPGFVGRIVRTELFSAERFLDEGLAAVRQAARADQPWLFVVTDIDTPDGVDLERLARGMVPGERADRVRMDIANLSDLSALRELLREATTFDGLRIVIVRDGPPARFDPAALGRALAEIDRLGYQPRQRLVRSIDSLCAIRPIRDDEPARVAGRRDGTLQPQAQVEKLPSRYPRRMHLRVRPLVEQVDVIRTRAPARIRGVDRQQLPAPGAPLHGRQSMWRAHVAGFTGDPPGLAARALSEAGRIMGFAVRLIHDATPVGAGRRAWSQVLLTHPRAEESSPPVTGLIPFGEADLMLGVESHQTLRSLGPDPRLRVAYDGLTFAVANSGRFLDEPGGDLRDDEADRLVRALDETTRSQPRMVDDFARACRGALYNDRLVDLAMLGAAYQLGLIPITLDAAEGAMRRLETSGFARSREAFQFGRRLALDRRLLARPREEAEEDVTHLARWMMLSMAKERFGGPGRAREFQRLIERSLTAMPGLAETDPGRQARRDFVAALYRCVKWGGLPYAEQYADQIMGLYLADRGDRGRALTRSMILPLAEALLIHDLLYYGAMALSAVQRREIRQRLNVKNARGDRVERRYLTRIDLLALRRRVRLDVRTSDWPVRLIAAGRRLVPQRWRGTRIDREIRDTVLGFVQRATYEASEAYDRWAAAAHRLHGQAHENRLRGMAPSELRMLLDLAPGAEGGQPSVAQGAAPRS